ncbi:GNAT family N-acetyltransferase [Streptomyces sp. NPDC006482]|uniref:GNAT family N-acetyltransferase n=1 Tax=Streptomyces sp. NPDC006482 TaxID=3154306 RepID=UPI0033B659B1
MEHVIEGPRPEDALATARMYLAAWLETYPDEAAGIDEEWIRKHRGPAATPEGCAPWRDFIRQADSRPDMFFCRVVRAEGEIVGILCGSRRDAVVDLGPMYLREKAQGRGVGGRMMSAFLEWAGDTPIRLWVTEYNERAVRFYERYGFVSTGERQLWRGRLPNVRMIRSARTPYFHS